MAYKNPIPMILDEPVSKKCILSFSFENYVTAKEAAESISQFIAEEYNGNIPEQWVKLENPTEILSEQEYYLPPKPRKYPDRRKGNQND